MKKLLAMLTIISFIAMQGCSAFKDTMQTMNVQCAQPDTALIINGEVKPCPTQMNVKRNRDVSIQAQKTGYFPYMRTIGHHLSVTGALDAVGTLLILVPGIGLITSGAWDLDETDIMISLMPNAPQSVSMR